MTAILELSESQAKALEQLAMISGRTQSDLMQEAIERLLEESNLGAPDWHEILRSGEGLWEHRTDLPDFEAVRRELDRDHW